MLRTRSEHKRLNFAMFSVNKHNRHMPVLLLLMILKPTKYIFSDSKWANVLPGGNGTN